MRILSICCCLAEEGFHFKGWEFGKERKVRIEHVALYVKDLERARDFYIKYFGVVSNDGYYNRKTGFRSYFLSFGDGARLELMNKADAADSQKQLAQMGYIHIALSVGDRERVDELTNLLKEDGYKVISGPRGYRGRGIMKVAFWIRKGIR